MPHETFHVGKCFIIFEKCMIYLSCWLFILSIVKGELYYKVVSFQQIADNYYIVRTKEFILINFQIQLQRMSIDSDTILFYYFRVSLVGRHFCGRRGSSIRHSVNFVPRLPHVVTAIDVYFKTQFYSFSQCQRHLLANFITNFENC